MREIQKMSEKTEKTDMAQPDRRLLSAVALGAEAVAAAIADGAGAKAAGMLDLDGCTPFLLAAMRRDLRSVELLAPLSDARACNGAGQGAMALALIGRPGEEKSIEALDEEAAAVIEVLARVCNGREADNQGETALMVAAGCGLPRCVELLIPLSDVDESHPKHGNALACAAASNQSECLRLLLAHGAVSKAGRSERDAVMAAAEHGSLDCMKILLAHGCAFKNKGHLGSDALDLAMSDAHCGAADQEKAALETGRALLAAWSKDSGETARLRVALRAAVMRPISPVDPRQVSWSQRWIRELAPWTDVNARGPMGGGELSALERAARKGMADVVQTLLDVGANPNARNAAGRSALDQLVAQWDGSPTSDVDSERYRLRWQRTAEVLARASSKGTIEQALGLAATSQMSCFDAFKDICGRESARREAEELREDLASRDGEGLGEAGGGQNADGAENPQSRRRPKTL